jgi:hypothetical protein
MIVASLTPPPFLNLRELCARRTENSSASPPVWTIPAFLLLAVGCELLAAIFILLNRLGPHTNPRNSFPLIALLHTSLYISGVGVHRLRSSRAETRLPANSIRIRTYAKRTRNPFRIRTSKTQDLKPFRMNTYRKKGRGVPRGMGQTSVCLRSGFLLSQD